jgi:uncharacterized protein (DUF2344 family)
MKKLFAFALLLLVSFSSIAQKQETLSKWFIEKVTHDGKEGEATRPLLTFYIIDNEIYMAVEAEDNNNDQIWGVTVLIADVEKEITKDNVYLSTSEFIWKSTKGNWKVLFIQGKTKDSDRAFSMTLTQISSGTVVVYSGIEI